MSSILVRDHMQADAQSVLSSFSVSEVIEHLLRTHLTGVPVVDEQQQVVGFVSEQDCMKEMLHAAFFGSESPSVTRIMHTPVLTVTPDTSIVEIAETMMDHKPKNYPVVYDGKLVGIINRRHILNALIDNARQGHCRY